MKNIFLPFIVIFFSCSCLAQASDFIILKKDQRTVKTYFAGSDIEFITAEGYYAGQINLIHNDSVYLLQYDIRKLPTNLGIYIVDTVAVYHTQFNYKDILTLGRKKEKGFNLGASGVALIGGAITIVAVGLATWVFTKPGTTYHASPALVGAAAVLGAAGYLIYKLSSPVIKIGTKYRLEYIAVK